jgi:hypothetical protein
LVYLTPGEQVSRELIKVLVGQTLLEYFILVKDSGQQLRSGLFGLMALGGVSLWVLRNLGQDLLHIFVSIPMFSLPFQD